MNNLHSSPLLLFVRSQIRTRGRQGITPLILQKAIDAINNILVNCCTYQFASRVDPFLNTVFTLLRTMNKATDRQKLRAVLKELQDAYDCCDPQDGVLSFVVNNADVTGIINTSFVFQGIEKFSIIAEWGDGKKDYYKPDYQQTITHTYKATGNYTVKLTFNNITTVVTISATNDNISSVAALSQFTKLSTLVLSNNKLTAFNIALPSTLTSLALDHNVLDVFAPTNPLPVGLPIIDISFNGLTQADINQTLVYMDAATFSGPVNLTITQSPAVTPSAAGATAFTNLTTVKNWTITN